MTSCIKYLIYGSNPILHLFYIAFPLIKSVLLLVTRSISRKDYPIMKVKSYKSTVMSILLIARVTWKMAAKAEQKLNIFHHWCFRRTLGIIGTYQDCPKWRDTEIMHNWETNGHNHETSDKIIVTNSMSFRPKTPKKPHYDGCQSVARGSEEVEKYLEVQYPQWPSTASVFWAQIEEIVVNRDESKEVVARCTVYMPWMKMMTMKDYPHNNKNGRKFTTKVILSSKMFYLWVVTTVSW